MLWILIICITMAIISATCWCLEAMIYVRAVKSIPPAKNSFAELSRTIKVISYTGKLLPLGLDIACTLFLISHIGLTGLIGATMGLTISNVISGFILWIFKSKPSGDRREPVHK